MPTPAPPSFRRLRPAGRCCLAWWILSFGLGACSQPASAPLVPGCEPVARAESVSLRLLVSFHQPTIGDAPAVLAQLQTAAGSCVRYVSTVSPTLHAYVIDTSADTVNMGARLLRWPAVKAVEVDAPIRRH